MNVSVWNGSQRIFHGDLSALGIGHIQQDLVLVPQDGEPTILGPDRWTRLCVDRIEAPVLPAEVQPPRKRAIAFSLSSGEGD